MNLLRNLEPDYTKDQSLYKLYIKVVRANRYYHVIQVNKQNKKWLSLQFQKPERTLMIVPYTSRHYRIQLHIDKRYNLVKFMKVRINPRTNGRQQR